MEQETEILPNSAVVDVATLKRREVRLATAQSANPSANWMVDLGLFVVMVIILAGLGLLFHTGPFTTSRAPYFVVQAQVWLDGRFDVTGLLGSHDTVIHDGLLYIVYPPLPAILMLPFVAILGPTFSDIWFTWGVAALNVVFVYHILDVLRAKGWSQRTQRENIFLAILFGIGTVGLWLALEGDVWFTSQTVVVLFLLLMILATLQERWWIASLAVGLVFLTRSDDVVAGVFPLIFYARSLGDTARVQMGDSYATIWQNLRAWRPARAPRIGEVIAFVVPFGICAAILLVRNQIYFGSVLSTGYDLQIQQDYPSIHYGLLSWHYLWPNFVADFLNLPSFVFTTHFDTFPHVNLYQNGDGTSLFFSTPLFLLFFVPTLTRTSFHWLRITLWSVVVVMLTPTLLFNGTGFSQVGARYLFDVYPFLWMLLALRANTIGWRWITLAAASVAINIALAQTFWCVVIYKCAETATSHTRSLLYTIILMGGIALCFAAGWWIMRDPQRERQSFEFVNRKL